MILILLFGGPRRGGAGRSATRPSREFHRVRRHARRDRGALPRAAALAVGMDATFLDRDFGDV